MEVQQQPRRQHNTPSCNRIVASVVESSKRKAARPTEGQLQHPHGEKTRKQNLLGSLRIFSLKSNQAVISLMRWESEEVMLREISAEALSRGRTMTLTPSEWRNICRANSTGCSNAHCMKWSRVCATTTTEKSTSRGASSSGTQTHAIPHKEALELRNLRDQINT